MNKPRNPTQNELEALSELVLREAGEISYDEEICRENYREAQKALNNMNFSAVFDDFKWVSPQYSHLHFKKLMVVVWNHPKDQSPYGVDIFAWDNANMICHLNKEWNYNASKVS